MNDKKVIITGVSGQVGSYMAEYCLKINCEVYGIVRRTSTPNNLNFKHLLSNPKFHLISADLTDGSSISEAVKSVNPDCCRQLENSRGYL
jgi:GDPmannose 4,6-dehydratase